MATATQNTFNVLHEPWIPTRNLSGDLAERGIGKPRFRRHVGRLGQLGRGRPRPHPATLIAPGKCGRWGDEDEQDDGVESRSTVHGLALM